MKGALSIAITAGIFLRVRLIVPSMFLSFGLSVRARLADVKKLSVVTFLPFFKYGDMDRITALSGSNSLAERISSFPSMGRRYIHIWCHYLLTSRILSHTCQVCSSCIG